MQIGGFLLELLLARFGAGRQSALLALKRLGSALQFRLSLLQFAAIPGQRFPCRSFLRGKRLAGTLDVLFRDIVAADLRELRIGFLNGEPHFERALVRFLEFATQAIESLAPGFEILGMVGEEVLLAADFGLLCPAFVGPLIPFALNAFAGLPRVALEQFPCGGDQFRLALARFLALANQCRAVIPLPDLHLMHPRLRNLLPLELLAFLPQRVLVGQNLFAQVFEVFLLELHAVLENPLILFEGALGVLGLFGSGLLFDFEVGSALLEVLFESFLFGADVVVELSARIVEFACLPFECLHTFGGVGVPLRVELVVPLFQLGIELAAPPLEIGFLFGGSGFEFGGLFLAQLVEARRRVFDGGLQFRLEGIEFFAFGVACFFPLIAGSFEGVAFLGEFRECLLTEFLPFAVEFPVKFNVKGLLFLLEPGLLVFEPSLVGFELALVIVEFGAVGFELAVKRLLKFVCLFVEFFAACFDVALAMFELLDQFVAAFDFVGELGFARIESLLAGMEIVFELPDGHPDTAAFLVEQRQLFVERLLAAVQFGELITEVFGDLARLQQQLIFAQRAA